MADPISAALGEMQEYVKPEYSSLSGKADTL